MEGGKKRKEKKEGEKKKSSSRRVWACIQERPSNGVLRVTEVTARALFFFLLLEFWRGAKREEEGERWGGGQEKQREKVNPGKRKRVCRNSGYWLYRPFEFIYFSFTRGATLAFSPSLQPNHQPSLALHPFSPVFSLTFFLSLFLSLSPLPFWHFYSTTVNPVSYVARIHFVPSSTHPIQPIEARASLTLLTSLSLPHSLPIGYLFAIVPTFLRFTRGYIGLLLCPWPTRFPSNDKKHETDTRAACRSTTEIPRLPPTPLPSSWANDPRQWFSR